MQTPLKCQYVQRLDFLVKKHMRYIMVIKMDFRLDFSAAIEEVTRLMGLNALKSKQTEGLLAFVSGKDTFVTLPTGYGKSVIFAVLPLLFDKLLGRSYNILMLQLYSYAN